MLTKHEQMKELLGKTGIAAKEIKCYGSQIMITCLCRKSAEEFVSVLQHMCTKLRLWDAIDETQTGGYQNVYRVWGTI